MCIGPARYAGRARCLSKSAFPPEEFRVEATPFLALSAIFPEYDPEPHAGGAVAMITGDVVGAQHFDILRFGGKRGEKEQGSGGA